MNCEELQDLLLDTLYFIQGFIPRPGIPVAVTRVLSLNTNQIRYRITVDLLYPDDREVTTQFYADTVFTTAAVRTEYNISDSLATNKSSIGWASTLMRVIRRGDESLALCCVPDESRGNIVTHQRVYFLTREELSIASDMAHVTNE